jgi:NitT/TauT family transport system ATP-binding protein
MTQAGAQLTVAANEIVFDRVSKAFDIPGRRTVQAVEDVTGKVSVGEFVSIVGPSGCGKSTLLAIVAGLDNATGGSISVGGATVDGPRRDIGLVFQEDSTLPWRSALRNVTFGMEVAGVPRGERMRRATDMLNMVGLAEFAEERPARLSGGMRQRLAIARTLAMRPSVLLMDEPFGALDAQTRAMMQENLLRLWAEFKITVIFVTHDVDEAIFLADRVLIMSAAPGRIIEDVTVPLPRPRNAEISTDPEFVKLKRHFLQVIRAESLKAFEDQDH